LPKVEGEAGAAGADVSDMGLSLSHPRAAASNLRIAARRPLWISSASDLSYKLDR